MKTYRNEWKYCCSENTLDLLDERMASILAPDSNGEQNGVYEVHSLYYDDYKDTCARENEAGVSQRFKYRVRYYGNYVSFIKLEKKEKFNGRCYKESCTLSQEVLKKLLDDKYEEVFWEAEHVLLKKFCVDCMKRLFRPKVIVDYERKAYVEPVTNIRITLDRNISVSDRFDLFLEGDYQRIPLQAKGQHVLEVKFDSILPGYIKYLVLGEEMMQTSFSKYYYGRIKLQNMQR